jgi:hypothetical protein
MNRRRIYSHIYQVQRIILMVFYVTTAVALAIPLARLLAGVAPGSLFLWAGSLILYMAGAVALGSFIYMVSYIPFNLAAAFDPIKNDMAKGAITDATQFGRRVTSFTTHFFDFSFLDISHAFFETESSGLVSHEEMPGLEEIMEQFGMKEKSGQLEEIIRAGKIDFQGREYHLYILPIWFGGTWLGYMGLLTEKRISRFFQRVLMEFENNFLDDLLMLVLRSSNHDS